MPTFATIKPSRTMDIRDLAEGGEGLFEAGGVFYVGGVEGAVDLAVEAGEDFAGAYFDVVGYARSCEQVMHSTQRTAPVTWRMRASRMASGRMRRRASTLAATGKARVWKATDSSWCASWSWAGCMSGQWKGPLTGSMTVRLAPLFAEGGGALDGGDGAGDDGLVGGVEVGGGDDAVGGAFGGDGRRRRLRCRVRSRPRMAAMAPSPAGTAAA